ncbi:NAD(P)/FAD-dependent oxidoreductase [Leucothrix arctica]|uniref:Ferredoxin-NAD reductase n=1 Tax=Leucothrix arctica TaxID=1481894 RepID=A0A317CM21_9GAMM|nr:FAD-dependent oxidoreductase [Leucothrix arctica]PWQ99578.1 ferredoxin-NAD reductase [Leucothrix arctica]
MKSVVIIGASHAAVDAISTLRKKGWSGKVVLVGDEVPLPYHRPPLSKAYLQDQISEEKLLIRNEQFYQDSDVTLMLGRRAESINRETHSITLDGGETLAYDKLILATGTRTRYFPIKGGDLPSVHYLRTKADADRIKTQLVSGKKILLIGAGYIGLEIAASAVKSGCEVVVVELADRVLARVTSPEVSSFYQRFHAEQGVDIRLNTGVQSMEVAGAAYRATLNTGGTVDFDAVVIGIGVVPNVELAEDAGLSCDNGILVNEFGATDDEDIYAVGDCSRYHSLIYDRKIRLESIPNASGQARTAAAAICADEIAYNEVPWFWSDQYDIKLQTAGLFEGYDEVVVRGNPSENKFSVFYLKAGRVLAVDAINSPMEFMIAKKLILAKAVLEAYVIRDMSIKPKDFLG